MHMKKLMQEHVSGEFNVPKSLILKGGPTETNYTIVRGTSYTRIGVVWKLVTQSILWT